MWTLQNKLSMALLRTPKFDFRVKRVIQFFFFLLEIFSLFLGLLHINQCYAHRLGYQYQTRNVLKSYSFKRIYSDIVSVVKIILMRSKKEISSCLQHRALQRSPSNHMLHAHCCSAGWKKCWHIFPSNQKLVYIIYHHLLPQVLETFLVLQKSYYVETKNVLPSYM